MSARKNTSGRPDAAALERELRTRYSTKEYAVLQSRLTGAVKAFVSLHERAPDLLPFLVSNDTAAQAKTLPIQTQTALATIIRQLVMAAADDGHGRIDRKKLLRLVEQRLT